MKLSDQLFMQYMAQSERIYPNLSESQKIQWAEAKVYLAMRGKDPCPISNGWQYREDYFRFRRGL